MMQAAEASRVARSPSCERSVNLSDVEKPYRYSPNGWMSGKQTVVYIKEDEVSSVPCGEISKRSQNADLLAQSGQRDDACDHSCNQGRNKTLECEASSLTI